MVTFEALQSRIEAVAFMEPNHKSEDIRSYLYICGEAHNLLLKLVQIQEMDLPEEIELPILEKRVKELEEKVKRLI